MGKLPESRRDTDYNQRHVVICAVVCRTRTQIIRQTRVRGLFLRDQ